MNTVEIIPAILPRSFKDLEAHAARVPKAAKAVQIDIVDGHFARSKTWPYKDHATFEKILKSEQGLPGWEDHDFEFDLMIENPKTEVMHYVHAGATRIAVHAGAHGAVEALTTLTDLREEGGAFSIEAGVALKHDMQPEALEHFETYFDYVQVMGIDRVGYQGEKFNEHAVALVERLRKRYSGLVIQVDGGVNMQNVRRLAQAGANRLVVGSALFGAENPKEAYEALYNEANGG